MSPPKLIDPQALLEADRQAASMPSSKDVVTVSAKAKKEAKRSTHLASPPSDPIRADFRVFLTLVWRHLLGVDPNPIQLDMAYWLQHGPDRAIIMAFRGFSKSWITGAYALWRLYCDSDEKILVVSGSLKRAIATTNWCLGLIMSMDILKDLRPKPSYRQSSQMFDVGNCTPAQSASFMAAGIGGQLVGFRGTCIIPDDVETQTNSLTVVMREKIEDAVKEFESVLTPGGVIKYLGTPHDVDSLYMKLLRLKDVYNRPVYQARIWPALFPTDAEIKDYGDILAPYIPAQLRKQGPSIVGHSTMPQRFTDEDLEKRRAAMGNTEFRLQFMLDLKGSFIDKYPLKLRDLIVMDIDPKMAPEEVAWGTTNVLRDLPVMGFDGDFYHGPVHVGEHYSPFSQVLGYVDGSGRGTDETTLTIGGELFGRVFCLYQFASTDGYGEDTLTAIAKSCVRYGVHVLYLEGNYGDGMLGALLKPVLRREWDRANKRRKADEQQGTRLEEVISGKAQKEKRVLSVLEPVTQQHRLVIHTSLVKDDWGSLQKIEGEDTRHRYALFYQYTHITPERDCLAKDDRIEGVAGLVSLFAEALGVDPLGMSIRSREEREDDWLSKLLDEAEEAVGRNGKVSKGNPLRTNAAQPTRR